MQVDLRAHQPGHVGVGDSGSQLWAAGAIGGSVRVVSRLRGTLEIGYGGVPPTTIDWQSVGLTYLPLRAGLAFRPTTPIELRVYGEVAPYWVRGDVDGPQTLHRGVLGGGGAGFYVYLPPRRRVQLLAAAGVDLFAGPRSSFLIHGQSALRTERAGFWIGLRLAVAAHP
jgi:hypothetical protein